MRLPAIAIKNAQFVLIIILIACALGIQSFINMPRSEDPQIDLPGYNIVAVYPGTSPEDMEELIVDPLEEVIDELDDIEEIVTEIEEGLATITIQASFDIDPNEKYDEVVREVNKVLPDLPDGIVFFDVTQFKPEDRTVIHQYALVGEDVVSYATLYDYAEALEGKLDDIDGVKGIEIQAYPEEEVRISLDFQRMANLNVSLPQVLGVLSANNTNIPGGEVESSQKKFSLKTTGGYKNLADIRNTVIMGANGKLVYLSEFATVTKLYEDPRWEARYNQQRGVLVSLKLERGFNILKVIDQVKATEAVFKEKLPPNIELFTAFEQAPAVKGRIDDFFLNLIQGVLLVGAIILLFLGWRASMIVMMLIPLCVIMALAVLNGMGYGLQQISIASLVLALGLLVDNGIVVVENINRFVKEGMPLRKAAAKGVGEVGYAIISSTATTLLSFYPLTQLGEGPGEFLRSLPLTVMIALIISLILALTFSPILASGLLKKPNREKPSWISRFLNGFIERLYRPLLIGALKRGWLVVILAAGIFVGGLSLFPYIGISFFPTADKPLLLIEVDTPVGTNIKGTNQAVAYVESILDTTDFVKNYTSNVGHGNPQIYYNRIPEQYKENHGQVMVNFKDWNPAKFYETLANFRIAFEKFPGATITFSELKNGAPFKAPIEIRIIGEDLDTLRRIATDVESLMEGTPGVLNVNNALSVNRTELNIKLNKEKAGLANLSYLAFDQTVRASLTGIRVGEAALDDYDGDKYPIVVRMQFDPQPKITDFNKVYFTTPNGKQIPFRQVADVNFESASSEILHYNLDRHASILADVEDADQTVPLTQQILDELANYPLPEGYSFFAAGEYQDQQEAFGSLGVILILAQVAIFAVLVLQFRSIIQPLIVFSAIPLAATGSFVALYLTGWPFSFFAFVGLISLVGIVVNNSIIMVDYINQLHRSGTPFLEAIQIGSERRFVPIVLTTMTTILGLAPLTLSISNLWSPLGWTIIGGMISSTLLTLFMVPVLYKWFTKKTVATEELVDGL